MSPPRASTGRLKAELEGQSQEAAIFRRIAADGSEYRHPLRVARALLWTRVLTDVDWQAPTVLYLRDP